MCGHHRAVAHERRTRARRLRQLPALPGCHLREAVGDRIYGCDDCQEVCPPSVRFGDRHTPGAVDDARAWVQVMPLLQCSDHDLIEQWGAWYLAGREPRWIRRNALVVLGNVGDPAAADVQRVLGEYLLHRDPMHHLMPATDPHPDVQHELQACR